MNNRSLFKPCNQKRLATEIKAKRLYLLSAFSFKLFAPRSGRLLALPSGNIRNQNAARRDVDGLAVRFIAQQPTITRTEFAARKFRADRDGDIVAADLIGRRHIARNARINSDSFTTVRRPLSKHSQVFRLVATARERHSWRIFRMAQRKRPQRLPNRLTALFPESVWNFCMRRTVAIRIPAGLEGDKRLRRKCAFIIRNRRRPISIENGA